MKILFICTSNINRSPTFEKVWKKKKPKDEVDSCGTDKYSMSPLIEQDLQWADTIYVMEITHAIEIEKKFGSKYRYKINVIGVGDLYDRNQPELIKIAEDWIEYITPKCSKHGCNLFPSIDGLTLTCLECNLEIIRENEKEL